MPDTPAWWTAVTPAASPAAAAPAPAAAPAGGESVETYIRQAAAQRGIDPDVAVRVAQGEGGLVPNRTGSFATGKSFWPFQLHYGGAGTPYASFGTVAGMGNSFTAKTGWQPGDPEAWRAATDYALDAAKQQGWGAWYGARNQGITGYQGINRGAAGPPAGRPSAGGPDWWQAVPGMRDLVERPGTPVTVQTLPDSGPAGAAGARPQPLAQPVAATGGQPAWWGAVAGDGGGRQTPGPVSGRPSPEAPASLPPAQAARQAAAASWALSQLGSKDFYNLCQRFIEQAYGTGGQYGSAAAAGKALFKTANPAEADVGDLVFFRPDASNGFAGHAAVYLGNGEMVGATNAGVTRDNFLSNPYWRNLLVGFGDPPSQWQGRSAGGGGGGTSSADLAKGASTLVSGAREALGTAPTWWSSVTGR